MAVGIDHVLVGAGGHAKVVLALAQSAGLAIRGVCDPALAAQGVREWRGIAVLGDDSALDDLDPAAARLLNGVGQLPGQDLRKRLFESFTRRGFRFPALVHSHAWVAPGCELADGVQVMAGAIVQPDCRIGENSIVNTGSRIDHDCRVGRHCHVAPGAVLCGTVELGEGSFVGSGSIIVPGTILASGSFVRAGVLVTRREVRPVRQAARQP